MDKYIVKNMCDCTLRVEIYWLMEINRIICQHKLKKETDSIPITVILLCGYVTIVVRLCDYCGAVV